MKNKKGFTLVELIVAIAIVISILLIAIVSVTKISTKQKENAYEQVKQEVIGAAEDYFYANEYKFETLMASDDGSYKTISLRDLVNDGYLTILTNPVTGKKLYECSQVKIKKTPSSYTFEFDENTTGGCSSDTLLVTESEPGSPTININHRCGTEGDNGWCINTGNVTITVGENGGPPISKIYECKDEECEVKTELNSTESHTKKYTGDGYHTYYYEVVNSAGKSAKSSSAEFKIDKTLPEIKFGGQNNYIGIENSNVSWVNVDNNYFNVKVSDTTSGINTSGQNGKIIKVQTNPVNKTSFTGTLSEDYKDYYTHNSGTYIISGSITGDGARKQKYTVKDNAGHEKSVTIYAKFDTIAPVLAYKNISNANTNSSNTKWGGSASFSIEATDSLSGIDKNGVEGGLFKASWNNSNQTSFGEPNHASDIIYENGTTKNNNTALITKIANGYKRTDGSLGSNGYRIQRYEVCDKVGNCSEENIYAKIDNTPPTATLSRSSSSIIFGGSGADTGGSKIVKYAFSTATSASNVSASDWQNVTNQSNSLSGITKSVNGNTTSPSTYYLYIQDGAGNIGKSTGLKGYKLCDAYQKKEPIDSGDKDVAKAYMWDYVGKNCTGSNPVRVYSFKEIQCTCNIDINYSKNCGYVKYTDITSTTHPNYKTVEGKTYNNVSYINYQNSDNGRKACNGTAYSYNQYVNNVCDYNYAKANGYVYHGFVWFSGASNTNSYNLSSGFTTRTDSVWYHNGGGYDQNLYNYASVGNTNYTNVCNAACNAKYGKVN